jgi:peroxiredoxin
MTSPSTEFADKDGLPGIAVSSPAKRGSFFYLTCIVVLMVSNGLVVWKYLQLREAVASGNGDSKNAASLVTRPLETPNGPPVVIGDSSARYAVLFVFTHSDCPPCLSELSGLHRITERRSDVKVYGLMSHASSEEIEQTRSSFGISFPILSDPSGEIAGRLKLPKTPWKIVINLPTRRVVYEDPPSLTDAEREAFITRVSNLSTS